MIRIEHHELGPRLWVGRWRVHHWHWGTSLIAVGVWLVYGDRDDLLHSFDPEIGVITSDDKGVW